MANTQVKFHSVTQDQYSGITSPSDGSLYFISDNGEIRKGDQHIVGSRVFTATDATGKTAIKDLDIKLDGVSIRASEEHTLTDEDVAEGGAYAGQTAGSKVNVLTDNAAEGVDQPKRGDMLIVNGAGGLSSYVYNKNGGAYNPVNWLAASTGTMDASKILITEDLTMAGNYDKVGNFVKTSEGQKIDVDGNGTYTTGMTFQELLEKMFSQVNDPSWVRNPPTASISAASAGTVEYGATASSKFTASLNDAYAKYDGGSNQMAGCSASKYHFDGDATGQSTNNVTKTWVAGVESAPSASVTIDYGASTKTIKNNIDQVKFAAGAVSAGTTTNTASTTASITVIRNWFYGVDKVGGTIDSALIRGLTAGGNCETATKKSFVTGAGAKRVIIAIPQKKAGDTCIDAAKTLKEVLLVSASNTPIYSKNQQYFKQAESVTVEGANGATGVAYDVWVYQPASISPTEEHEIEIG